MALNWFGVNSSALSCLPPDFVAIYLLVITCLLAITYHLSIGIHRALNVTHYFFSLNISYQAFLSHYSGSASQVLVVTEQGLRLQLPASRFRPFLSQIGVKGRFRLTTDHNNKFVKLEVLL